MATITAAQLKALFPNSDNDYLEKVVNDLNTDPIKYGLDTPLRCAHFFAQVMQETGAKLVGRAESLQYEGARLPGLFHYYALHRDEAMQDGGIKDHATNKFTRDANQQVIANKAYANRPGSGNGDVASGDGWLFRGRGFIQVTGRANYVALTNQYRLLYGESLDFVAQPDLVLELPYTVRSAVCYWIQHNLHKKAENGDTKADVDAITDVIDPGAPDLIREARFANFQKALQVFPAQQISQ